MEIEAAIKSYLEIIVMEEKNLLKSSNEFPNAILVKRRITTKQKTRRFGKNNQQFLDISQIQKILKAVPQFQQRFPHLFDKKGNLNFREYGEEKKEIILLFDNKTNLESICNDLTDSFEKMKRNLPKGMIYLFETFEGNPLNSRANYSKVKVKNPDPAANLEYYSSFGKPDQCVREKGIDWVTFKTLNYILPAVEDHAKWRKTQKKKKPWFRLKPDDENKASPQFCILKRNYNPDNQHEKLLNYCKERFPKKEVFVKKSSVVSNAFPKETTPPTKVDPVPQINTKKETGKEVIKKENTTVVKQEKKEETKKTDNIKTTKPYVIIEKKGNQYRTNN